MKKIFTIIIFAACTIICCNSLKEEVAAEDKFKIYCGSCHLSPALENIPKSIWKNDVLPEMAARMGYRYDGYNPFKNSIEENYHTKLSNVYPEEQTISVEDWNIIHDYILSHAPDTVSNPYPRLDRNEKLSQFEARSLPVNQANRPTGIINIKFDTLNSELLVCDIYGNIFQVGHDQPITSRLSSPVVSTVQEDNALYVTEIGIMNPSEIPRGVLHKITPDTTNTLIDKLHRPVYTVPADLNEDGEKEILICEYGYHTGELSLLSKSDGIYQKETLVPIPGSIKLEVADMNNDGKKDIIALFAQGKEGIYILYQYDNLKFKLEQVISFGPEYGISWFELVDYNADGHKDLVVVNGDNADYSIFLKPYHGIRLFLNNGQNQFQEKWFYPIHGATRVIAEDFDKDADLDFAVLSYFPDFENNPEEGFVYLENEDKDNFIFKSYTTQLAEKGNWLIMEKGDIDKDGDIDLFLSNFPLLAKNKAMRNSKINLMILENKEL